jgi:hypothetical protein
MGGDIMAESLTELQKQKEDIQILLSTLEEAYNDASITKEHYDEVKSKNQKKLEEINLKIIELEKPQKEEPAKGKNQPRKPKQKSPQRARRQSPQRARRQNPRKPRKPRSPRKLLLKQHLLLLPHLRHLQRPRPLSHPAVRQNTLAYPSPLQT